MSMKGSLRTVASGGTLAAVFASSSDVYFFLATISPTQGGASVTDFYTNTATASLTYSSLNDLSGTDVAISAGNINRNSVILALDTGPTISATIQGSPVKVTTPVPRRERDVGRVRIGSYWTILALMRRRSISLALMI